MRGARGAGSNNAVFFGEFTFDVNEKRGQRAAVRVIGLPLFADWDVKFMKES